MQIFDLFFSRGDLWLFGIAGALGYLLLRARRSDELDRASKLRTAVSTYKSAFATEIAAVSNRDYAIDTFALGFQRHQTAVNIIRPLLPKRHQLKLQKAWNEYCGKDTRLGLDADEYVQALNATFYSADKETFEQFKIRFNVLHGCLDDLL